MNLFIQLCYLIAISIAVSAISVQLFARGKNLNVSIPLIKSGTTSLFLLFVLIFNFCDFLILFLGTSIGTDAVSWILVTENVMEVCMAYALIEMEREYFELPECKYRFIFFTVLGGLVLWIDAAYAAGIMLAGEGLYLVLMLVLNLLPIAAVFIFNLVNLRKILHQGKPALMEKYFIFYNLVFFFLCVVTTFWIIKSGTAADCVVDNTRVYVICWILLNVMNFVLIWNSCVKVGAEKETRKEIERKSEEQILRAKAEYCLSDREVEIARLICKGKNNNDIASDLFVSPNTVKVHTSNLYKKLGVKNRVQAVQVLHGEKIEPTE